MSKILVVDDDVDILDAVALILEEEEFEVETTPKGEETYDRVASFHPDLILLDVLMSGSDGRFICQKLKQDELTKKIPVIMISAHPSAKDGAMKCGAEDFLPKPFDMYQLLGKIQRHLSS